MLNKITDAQLVKKYIEKKQSSDVRKIGFHLSLKRLRQLMNTKRCYYSGVLFNDELNHPDHRTIERVDSSKGYTDNNTIVCVKRINDLKSNFTLEELEGIVKGIKKHQAKQKLIDEKKAERKAFFKSQNTNNAE